MDAALNKPNRAFFKLFEELIVVTKMVELYPYNESIDFLVGDVVECSYMKGFFKVLSSTPTFLVLVSVESDDSHEDLAYISPHFLRKIQVNQDVMRILFNAKD